MKVVFLALLTFSFFCPRWNGVLGMELSDEMKELLAAITPVFEENLKRAFRNYGVMTTDVANRPKFYPLDDVLIKIGDTIVELRDLKLFWTPDFRINKMSVNFTRLYLDVAFNLGDLRIEGEYEANNKTLQEMLPVSNKGKIVFVLENTTARGKVGIYIVEDSFVVANYDMKYETADVTIRTNYGGRENELENEIVRSDIGSTLVKTFWNQLTETLTNLLHRQLGAVIVEFSVTELLADNDEELRNYAEYLTNKGNRMLDLFLCSAKDYLVAESLRTVETPSFEVVFRKKQLGSFQAEKGYIEDLSTLTRLKDISFFEDGGRAVLYGNVVLRDFKHGYDSYTVGYMENEINGNIRTTIYQNRIFLKIEVSKGTQQCVSHLEDVQVRTVKDIDMDVSGLASLTWLTQSIGSWVVGNLRNQALPVLEKHIRTAFEHAIQKTDCTNLL